MKKRLTAAVLALCMAVFAFPLGVSAYSPALEVSPAYEGSVYYQRLSQVELTGDWRKDIVSVALSQVGYHEGDSKADYAGGNVKGWHNFTEYSSAYYGMDAQWCAMFVSWCARQAGIPRYVVNSAASAYSDGSGGQGRSCFHVSVYYKKNYIPAPGDLVFFSSTGWGTDHVGIVAGVTDTGIYTVEGNSLNAVRVKYYDFDDNYIVYYGVYAGQGESGPMEAQVSELRFHFSAGEHGTMPDGDEYSFDTLWAVHGTTFTLPVNAFVRQGHSLQGYFARREADGAWYCGASGWLSESEMAARGIRPALLADGSSWEFTGGWTESDRFALFCVWKNQYGVTVFDSGLPNGVKADGEGWVNPFSDLPESKWYYDTVRRACRLGLLPSGTVFRGEEAATRAQFVDMLYRGAGSPEAEEGTEAFADVPAGSPAYPAVLWARSIGLTQGTGGNRFSPDAAMSRQEMVTMLHRWLGDGETAAMEAGAFADAAAVSDWAADAMAWAVESGMIKGAAVGAELYLNPQTAASRAEALTVALRVTERLAEQAEEKNGEETPTIPVDIGG
ncbi:MAG: S-layer homology domain-containing protein [Oscillospiraceae bacterium]